MTGPDHGRRTQRPLSGTGPILNLLVVGPKEIAQFITFSPVATALTWDVEEPCSIHNCVYSIYLILSLKF